MCLQPTHALYETIAYLYACGCGGRCTSRCARHGAAIVRRGELKLRTVHCFTVSHRRRVVSGLHGPVCVRSVYIHRFLLGHQLRSGATRPLAWCWGWQCEQLVFRLACSFVVAISFEPRVAPQPNWGRVAGYLRACCGVVVDMTVAT